MDKGDTNVPHKIDPKPSLIACHLYALKATLKVSFGHQAYSLAAAMSFYAILSIAPVIVLLLTVAGAHLDREKIGQDVVAEVGMIAGNEAAKVAETIVMNASKPPPDRLTMILGFAILIWGATGVFNQLQDSLNFIWGVHRIPGRGLIHFVRARLTSIVMVFGVGFILLVLPLLTAVLTAINGHLVGKVPRIEEMWQYSSVLVSTLVLTLVFAAIFKLLPYVKIKWSDVWASAVGTAILITLGQYLIGVYLGYSGLISAYGAAGSLVVLLIWVYYSALIMFLGAEYSCIYARRFGSQAASSQIKTEKPD